MQNKIKRVIFASKNKNKLAEVREILKDIEIEVVSYSDFDDSIDIEENGNTFQENATIKAKEIGKRFNIPVISDDSGLIVDALAGAPGICSARYAGESATSEDNLNKIILEIKNISPPVKARFVCAAVFYDGQNLICQQGYLEGQLITTPHGINGFGYDPIFIPDGYELTLAEIPIEIKNKISHRFNAFQLLKDSIKKATEQAIVKPI